MKPLRDRVALISGSGRGIGIIGTRLTLPPSGQESIEVSGREIKVGMGAELQAELAAAIQLGRSGTPEEAAGAVYLLCLDEAPISPVSCSCAGVATPFDTPPFFGMPATQQLCTRPPCKPALSTGNDHCLGPVIWRSLIERMLGEGENRERT